MKPFLVILSLLLLALQARVLAQAEEGEETERVKYTLILPDEKTPELVKPEENNPFEAAAEGRADTEGDTEENQVRDLLLSMPIGGAVFGSNGMRVMLGGMRLEAGMEVPPIIPDQQVSLRVKSINTTAIELLWVEKKPTGLPPKLLVIPMDGSPSVRYRMPAGRGAVPGQGSMGTLRRPDVSAFSPPRQIDDTEEPTVAKATRVEENKPSLPVKPAKPSTPPANVPEASVLRMLFGNHAPTAK